MVASSVGVCSLTRAMTRPSYRGPARLRCSTDFFGRNAPLVRLVGGHPRAKIVPDRRICPVRANEPEPPHVRIQWSAPRIRTGKRITVNLPVDDVHDAPLDGRLGHGHDTRQMIGGPDVVLRPP